jgi:hypothetical protein
MSTHPITRLPGLTSMLALGVLLIAGCESGHAPVAPTGTSLADGPGVAGAMHATPATQLTELAALRRATARFHRVGAAEAEGYTVLVTHPESGAACLEHPDLGGMGRHLLNLDLVDGEASAAEPEVVIYEPGPNGKLRLVGVEYLIPFAILGEDQPAPVLFGQAFTQNETFGVWALHAWAWKNNPAGMFADWNPTVTCAFDDLVDG